MRGKKLEKACKLFFIILWGTAVPHKQLSCAIAILLISQNIMAKYQNHSTSTWSLNVWNIKTVTYFLSSHIIKTLDWVTDFHTA